MGTVKRFPKTNGFTLVELMVVVGIIGLLASVAIPNYLKYQAKAKTAEAKFQLASIYGIEISARADYNHFGTCLSDLGYIPAGKGYYLVGFGADATVANSNIRDNNGLCNSGQNIQSPIRVFSVRGHPADSRNFTANSRKGFTVEPAVSTDGGSFTAGAIGRISADVAKFDSWTINDNKLINHVQVGL